jgi:hypothetical protein
VTDTITVTINGRAVVFKRDGYETPISDHSIRWPKYRNGITTFIKHSDREWVCCIGRESSGWYAGNPEVAYEGLVRQSKSWAPVLRELARLGGDDGKAE